MLTYIFSLSLSLYLSLSLSFFPPPRLQMWASPSLGGGFTLFDTHQLDRPRKIDSECNRQHGSLYLKAKAGR